MWSAIKLFAATNWLRLAQIGGMIAGGLALFFSIRKGGRDAERNAQHERDQKTRDRMDRVPDATDGDTVDRLQRGDF